MPLGSRSLRRSTRCCRARYEALLHGAQNRQATRASFLACGACRGDALRGGVADVVRRLNRGQVSLFEAACTSDARWAEQQLGAVEE